MLFNSYIFIFLFLPVALLGYFGLNKIGKFVPAKYFLVGMSLWFYAYFQYSFVFHRSCPRPAPQNMVWDHVVNRVSAYSAGRSI